MSSASNLVKSFRKSSDSDAAIVFLNSVIPYLTVLLIAGYLSKYSYWWVLLLALPAHWFHARMFIIMHDCGHNSFARQNFFNLLFGHITSFFYFTPFLMWRELHNKHHRNQGNLQRRSNSLDVWTMTTGEYRAAGNFRKLLYRCYRNPLVLMFLAPLVLFFLLFRIPFEKFSRSAKLNIFALNLILLSGAYWFQDFCLAFLVIQLPSLLLSLMMASFLFYVQHQFESTAWTVDGEYTNELISLKGSSYLELPAFFNWTLGNIVYHHVHHLDVKIPMYCLPAAHLALSEMIQPHPLGFKTALSSLNLKLWDENSQKLVPF